MVKQILLNLLTNDVKFTQSGGEITLRSRLEEQTELVLEVSDTGIGMTEKDIPKALEPFRQEQSHMARGQEGTGLGLPLVSNFLTLHGGYLELLSRPKKEETYLINRGMNGGS